MPPRPGSLKKGQKRVQSVYDNIAASAANSEVVATETNGGFAPRSHDSVKQKAAVHRTPNNVTYVAVEGGTAEESSVETLPPHYPPPDYDDDGEEGEPEVYPP